MAVELSSFGYKDSSAPGASRVFDCRHLPNPYGNTVLRALNGQHPAVQSWLLRFRETELLIQEAVEVVKAGATTVAFGCFGGKHRSVALVELVGSALMAEGYEVTMVHKGLR